MCILVLYNPVRTFSCALCSLPPVVRLLVQRAMDYCHADISAVPVVYILHIALDYFQTKFNSSALVMVWRDLLLCSQIANPTFFLVQIDGNCYLRGWISLPDVLSPSLQAALVGWALPSSVWFPVGPGWMNPYGTTSHSKSYHFDRNCVYKAKQQIWGKCWNTEYISIYMLKTGIK